MSRKINRRSLIRGAVLSPIVAVPLSLKNTEASEGDYLKPLWLQRRRLITALSGVDQAWVDARSRLPDWCLPGAKYRDQNEKRIVGWPAAKSPVILRDGRVLLRPSPKDLRQLFFEDIGRAGLDAARLAYRARFKALRNQRTKQHRLEMVAGLPRSSDWQAIEKDIYDVERAILALRLDSDTVLARLLIAFQNQRNKSATEEDNQLSHLRLILKVYLTGQIPNLSGYLLEDLRTILVT